jgi:hypothetical protein
MNKLVNLCLLELKEGSYQKIDRIVYDYEIHVEEGDADDNEYTHHFHLVLENAIERLARAETKDKDFATWISRAILRYYGHHAPAPGDSLNRFNKFIKTYYLPTDLSESVLVALYSNNFESLDGIFKDQIKPEKGVTTSDALFEAATHIQKYAETVKGTRKSELTSIFEKDILNYLPEKHRKGFSYEKLLGEMDEVAVSKKSYRNRLMLGEADFSYTTALIKKHASTHPELAQSITATELSSLEKLHEVYESKVNENIAYIESMGGTVRTNTDATLIHSYKLPQKRYNRIHFNFPHDKSRYQERTLPAILKKFFQSAKEIQEIGDRIHMALPIDRLDFYHAYVYDIYEASAKAGYQLIKKRPFDEVRYPGYKHSMTNNAISAPVTEKGAREFIFEKTNYSYHDLLSQSPPRKKLISYDSKKYNYPPHVDTESGSSDYLTDEKEPKPASLKNS